MKKSLFLVALATAVGYNNAQAVDWNWGGDVRFRYESYKNNYTRKADTEEDRYRLRVRLGVNPTINEELSSGIRLSSEDSSNPTSRNQTLKGGFSGKDIYIDEAYINYHPKTLDGKFNVVLGKRDVAKTLNVVKDIVWDSDMTLEGMTLQYGKDVSGNQKAGGSLIAGYYMLDESANHNSPGIFTIQGAFKGKASGLDYNLGASYYDYVHVNNTTGVWWTGVNGNSNGPALYGVDFNIVELFGTLGGKIGGSVPATLYAQYARNTAIINDHNAVLAGLKLGDDSKPNGWALDGGYFYIEQYAVTPYTDGDRPISGTWSTDIKGVKIGATYQLAQNMIIGATYFRVNPIKTIATDTSLSAGDHRNLFQADVVVKF
jgi:hypothetical protein